MNKYITKKNLLGVSCLLALFSIVFDYLSLQAYQIAEYVSMFDLLQKGVPTGLKVGVIIGLFGVVMALCVVGFSIIKNFKGKSLSKICFFFAVGAATLCVLGAILIVANKTNMKIEFGLFCMMFCGLVSLAAVMLDRYKNKKVEKQTDDEVIVVEEDENV